MSSRRLECESLCAVLVVLVLVQGVTCSPAVLDLKGDADFRSISVEWKAAPERRAARYVVTYCEDQAWGQHRCKDKTVDKPETKPLNRNSGYDVYRTRINGLRLSTNYTVEVTPDTAEDPDSSASPQRARALQQGTLILQTKGFYARAINCLLNSSLVEIETGPYFGGKISVEGTTVPACSTEGDPRSPTTRYRLVIDHASCGSESDGASVKNFVLVQESLPILTHSTRRFMVLCNFVPHTFTVRAGVNLPDFPESSGRGDLLSPLGSDIEEVDPSELFDSDNSLFSARVGRQIGDALKLSTTEGQRESQKWSHLVLMVALVACAAVGVSCAVVHLVRKSKKGTSQSIMSDDSSVLDGSESEDVSSLSSCSVSRLEAAQSPCAEITAAHTSAAGDLTELDITFEFDKPTLQNNNNDNNDNKTDNDVMTDRTPVPNLDHVHKLLIPSISTIPGLTHGTPGIYFTTVQNQSHTASNTFNMAGTNSTSYPVMTNPSTNDSPMPGTSASTPCTTDEEECPSVHFIPAGGQDRAVLVNHLESIDAVFDEVLLDSPPADATPAGGDNPSSHPRSVHEATKTRAAVLFHDQNLGVLV